MSALRDEIRAILREELAALRGVSAPDVPQTEQVQITGDAALNRFARDLVARAASGDFAGRVARGDIVFTLAGDAPRPAPHPQPAAPIVTGPSRAQPATLDKGLITERDIAALAPSARSLRIAAHSRLTPLARDEARRKGIRIERSER